MGNTRNRLVTAALFIFAGLLLVASCLCITAPAYAGVKGEAPDGNVYSYEVASGKATITGITTENTTDYVIPETLDGFTVNAIGRYAFKTNSTMTSIIIPDTVVTLGDQAFACVTALKKVQLPSNYVGSLGDSLFWGCESLEEINLPEGVTSIGGWCFYNCISLKSITIPSTCTNIEKYAFNLDAEKESSLEEVIFPANDVSSLTSLGNYAFKHCTKLKELNLPSTVKNLGIETFRGCTSLEELTLPAGVVVFPICVIKGCENLKRVYIYGNVTSLSKNALGFCPSLEEVYFLGDISEMTFLDLPFERSCNITFYAYPQYSEGLATYIEEVNAEPDKDGYTYNLQLKDINEVLDQIEAEKGGTNTASYTPSTTNTSAQTTRSSLSLGSLSVPLIAGIVALFIAMELITILVMRRRTTAAVAQAIDAERLRAKLQRETEVDSRD